MGAKHYGKESSNYRHGGHVFYKHEHNSYRGMKGRCYYKKGSKYHLYGGRGITICDRWLGREGFTNFLNDMGRKPTPKHSIDRIDVNGNYEPANCRWATQREQMANLNKSRFITINGETKIYSEWCRIYNILPSVAHNREYGGWSPEDAITIPRLPVGKNRRAKTI